MALVRCSECGKDMSSNAAACPNCGNPSALRCPSCSSTDIETISGLKKGASAWAFGAFAANTILNNYKCRKCGHKFK